MSACQRPLLPPLYAPGAGGSDPSVPPPACPAPMCLVPRVPGSQAAGPGSDVPARLSVADWHTLFDAVTRRLRDTVHCPAAAAAVLPECIDALEWLQAAANGLQQPAD